MKSSLDFNFHSTHSQKRRTDNSEKIFIEIEHKMSKQWFYLHSDPIIYLHGNFNWILLFLLLLFLRKKNKLCKNRKWKLDRFIAFRDEQSLFSLFVRLLFGRSLANEIFLKRDIGKYWIFLRRVCQRILLSRLENFCLKGAFRNKISASKVRSVTKFLL